MAEDPFKKALKAWHASPYDFKEFGPIRDVSGKGQGAAAYGRGLYVAENPKVSGPGESEYMKEFHFHPHTRPENLGGLSLEDYLGDSPDAVEHRSGLVLYPGLKEEKRLNARQMDVLHKLIDGYVSAGKYQGYGKDLLGFMKDKGAPPSFTNHIRAFYSFGEGKGPFSYEVNVHLTPETMLDWDAPMGDHHPEAHDKIFNTHYEAMTKNVDDPPTREYIKNDPWWKTKKTGGAVYKDLAQRHGSDFAASEALYNAGIHGIRYKDGGSRGYKPAEVLLDGKPVDRGKVVPAPVSEEQYLDLLRITMEGMGMNTLQEAADHYRKSAEAWFKNPGNEVRDHIYQSYANAASWYDQNKHRIEVREAKPTYNYVIFHPDFVEAVAQYDIKGNKVKDLGPGVHLKAVDHDPFKEEK